MDVLNFVSHHCRFIRGRNGEGREEERKVDRVGRNKLRGTGNVEKGVT